MEPSSLSKEFCGLVWSTTVIVETVLVLLTLRTMLSMLSRRAAPSSSSLSSSSRRILFIAGAAFGTTTTYAASTGTAGSVGAAKGRLVVTTWNIAAINNNPFEYWIDHPDPRYNTLMTGVEKFLSDDKQDVKVEDVFGQGKYEELEALMRKQPHIPAEAIDEVRKSRWPQIKSRKIVSGFLKDAEIGKKRLASMPDRLTNTITVKTEVQAGAVTLLRPTPINCFAGRFASVDDWWSQWKTFMFDTPLPNNSKKNVASLLKSIPRSKYPELTEEDEKLSLPLQIVSIAVFDAILVHMLEQVGKDSWQDLRAEMCTALNSRKNDRVLEILSKTYGDSDVVCLQEVGGAFAARASQQLADFWVSTPSSAKALSRDQNSVLMLRKSEFPSPPVDVSSTIKIENAPVDDGDLLVVHATHRDGSRYVIASFHGDTDGLATIPILRAVVQHAQAQGDGVKFVFGLDANAYNKFKKGKQLDVREFNKEFRALKLTSCFGNEIDPTNFTTFNARTFLQPQLNKASGRTEFMEKGDVNPKDFILTFEQHGAFSETTKDNTGDRKYVEGMVFPTLRFPSDHGVLRSVLTFNNGDNCNA